MIPVLEVTKLLLFIVFPPCPGGVPRARSYQSVAIYRVSSPASHPRSYQSVAIYRVPRPARVVFAALEVTKMLVFIVSIPAQVVLRTLEFTKVSLSVALPGPLAQVSFPALEVTKVTLSIVLLPCLSRWCSPPSKLPKCLHLLGSRLCPGGVPCPRSYHSVAIYRVLAPTQVEVPVNETKLPECGYLA